MRKKKALLIPILFGMFLAGCGGSEPTPSPAPIKKASIKIESNEHITTSLQEGEYELNKAIDFTVSVVNEEYHVTSVKMNEVELPPANETNKYTFTPTEEKTYTLKVTTNKLENKIVYTFEGLTKDNYEEKLTKGGTKVFVNNYISEAGFENVFKDNCLNVANGKLFQLVCRTKSDNKDVWIRKIEFTFVGDKNQLALVNADEFESYANGVWTTSLTKGNQGQNSIDFKGVNEAVISKIVITTAPFVAEKFKINFDGFDNDDKVYSFSGFSYEEWQKKQPVTADTEFETLYPYYLYVEFGKYHAEYYSELLLKHGDELLRVSKLFDPEGKEIVVYPLQIIDKDVVSGKITLTASWTPKIANDHFVIDTNSANKYVKGFMETDPQASLQLGTAIQFGNKMEIQLRAKRGYKNLKMIINDQTIERDEEKDLYSFTVPFAKPINISFTAEEGDPAKEGKDVIALTGNNADKGVLLGAENEGNIYIAFLSNEDHPTAYLDALSFKGESLDPAQIPEGEDEPEGKIFKLSTSKQVEDYKAASDKSSLFTATIKEEGSYTSTIRINSGAFKVEIVGKESREEMGYTVYQVNGKEKVTIKFKLNEYRDLHSIEVNDKRLNSDQYVINQDGSISYTFDANAKNYDFLFQTKAQYVKLELDSDSTAGYKIKDLPADPVEAGKQITLTLDVTSDEYSLFGKNIKVTYNEKEIPVDENNFTFALLPVKGVSRIKVVVTEKPQ